MTDTAATEVHDAAGPCEPGYHRGSANLGWKTCRCGEVPIPDAKPDTAAALSPGVQRDIAAAVRQLGRAIEALRRVDRRLDGEDSERFGHTLDAACIASDGLLRFTDGGWASDVGIVRRHDGR